MLSCQFRKTEYPCVCLACADWIFFGSNQDALKTTLKRRRKLSFRQSFSCLFPLSFVFFLVSDPLRARTKLETLSELFDLGRFRNFNLFSRLFLFVSITTKFIENSTINWGGNRSLDFQLKSTKNSLHKTEHVVVKVSKNFAIGLRKSTSTVAFCNN